MAFWNAKSKDTFNDVEAVTIPAVRHEPIAVAVAAPAPRGAASVIALGAVVSGSLSSPGDVQVEGLVIGDVRCDTLVIGKSGEVKGNVISETATIRGKVSGDVRARMIQLAASGSIEGDLTHAVLIIEEGGVFEGRSKRSSDPLAGPALEAAKVEASEPEDKPAKKGKAGAKVAETPAAKSEAPHSSLADALEEDFAVSA